MAEAGEGQQPRPEISHIESPQAKEPFPKVRISSPEQEARESQEYNRERFNSLRDELGLTSTFLVRHNEDGSKTGLISYDAFVGASKLREVADLRLKAISAGMKEAAAPMVVTPPDTGPSYMLASGKVPEPGIFIQLIYEEKPPGLAIRSEDMPA